MKIKVYHGGTEAISSPRADAGRRNLDFGQGFYITDLCQQASDWAKHVSDRRQIPAVLNVYTLDRDAILANYRCKVFDAYDEDWLDFIVESRLGNNPWIDFDYVEGGVANDRIIDTINLYMADLMTRDKALERLSEHRPNNQMCLINQEIIEKYLTYDGTEEVH